MKLYTLAELADILHLGSHEAVRYRLRKLNSGLIEGKHFVMVGKRRKITEAGLALLKAFEPATPGRKRE